MPRCENCLHDIGIHTCIDKEGEKPRKGDITICYYCAATSTFDKDLNLIPLSEEEFDQIKKEDPKTFRLMIKASEIIRERIKNN